MEMLAWQLFTLEGANWQRAGGQGEKPELMTRPSEYEPIEAKEEESESVSLDDIRGELARRRAL